MSKIIKTFAFFAISPLFSILYAKQLALSTSAESAILINADTGAILYEKNAHKQQFPASITKVATALYALKIKEDALDEKVTADKDSIASVTEAAIRRSNYSMPAYWIEQGSSHIGIKIGEELTFRDLLFGMMLSSANDGANVIAQFTSGTIPEFLEEMNEFLHAIGCKNTYFCNPHGLHHPKHVTTAYDMSLIAKEAMKSPTFREVVSTVRYTRPKTNKQESTTLVQLNKLLRNGKYFYPKATGIKTGHTSFAMNTFVGAAKNGDRNLILVLLKTKERGDIFTDSIAMFEEAFKEKKVRKTLFKAGPQKFVLDLPGASAPITTYAKDNMEIDYYSAEEPVLKAFLQWDKIHPPIVKDQKVGNILVKNEKGEVAKDIPLFAEEDVSATWSYCLRNLFGR